MINQGSIIETPRLILRQWQEKDREPFAALNADPDVMRYFPSLLIREESDAFIDKSMTKIRERRFGFFAVEEKASGRLIGLIGLDIPSDDFPCSPCMEIGWRLAKEFWGRGYATEGAHACLEYAFAKLGRNEIVAFTSTLNQPSIRVMQRLGMASDPSENFLNPRVEDGHPLQEHVLYRLKKEDFINVRLVASEQEMAACFSIRHAVFILGQNVPVALEVDGLDPECRQYLLEYGGLPIGTARVRFVEGTTVKIERVAVDTKHQGKGFGKQLMDFILRDLKQNTSAQKAILGAQLEVISFYESLGFKAYGDVFLDAGIKHKMMKLAF
jgi:RimJ/RimL family protein N-acetyltransferase/predicted GNAT family N-acyltransferase